MRVLIDVGHPAHVHYFRHLAGILQEHGHAVLFTARPKEVTLDLLKHFGLPYKIIGKNRKGVWGKIVSLAICTFNLFRASLQFKPDILLNASPSAALVSWLLRKHHISLEDTFNMEQVRLYLPFTDVVLTGDYPHPDLGKKEISYPGYQELAYLHPNVYKPDEKVLETLGVKKGEKYAIVRFVAWEASHDFGHKGITPYNRIELVNKLSKYLKVFISSEGKLPEELKPYKIMIKPEQIHDALYYAHLFIGEGATMASESALLGTPAIYINNAQFGSTDSQAEFGLLYPFTDSSADQDKAICKAMEIAQQDNIKPEYARKRDALLKQKINLTSFLVWFMENYPESEREMRYSEFEFDRFKSRE